MKDLRYLVYSLPRYKFTHDRCGEFGVELDLDPHRLLVLFPVAPITTPFKMVKLLQDTCKHVLDLKLSKVPPETNSWTHIEGKKLARLGLPALPA